MKPVLRVPATTIVGSTFYIELVFINPLTGKSTAPLPCLVDTGANCTFLSRSVSDLDGLGLSFVVDADSDIGSTDIGNGSRCYTPLHLLRISLPPSLGATNTRNPCLKVGLTHGNVTIIGMDWLRSMSALIDTSGFSVLVRSGVEESDRTLDALALLSRRSSRMAHQAH
eukprot:TRINITY_DN498_c0_g1_i17.p1 TRINITY_DN498_c0_g1~~TRINITY_DN498_c0_g1_i17.p1  ORF type:complete len:169 (+),score=8.52 TRINITY_DN498_c0_g1_i17:19-525(+)